MVAAAAAPAALADASNGPRSQVSIKGAAGDDGPAEAARERAAAPGSPAKGSPAKGGSPRHLTIDAWMMMPGGHEFAR